MPKTKAQKETKKSKKIVDVIEIEPASPEEIHAELDPEVLEALNAKKVKKTKPSNVVDYIPELERDDSTFDLDEE